MTPWDLGALGATQPRRLKCQYYCMPQMLVLTMMLLLVGLVPKPGQIC